MALISRDLVASLIVRTKRDITDLNGFVAIGNEIERQNRYKQHLTELEAYMERHYAV